MRTKQLYIKRLGPEDAATVFSFTSNPAVARYMRFSVHKTLGEARELVEEYTAKGNAAFLYSQVSSRRAVGVFALKRNGEEPGVYDLSVFSDPAAWGRGYAGELLRLMVPFAREKLGARQLKAYVVSENLGSRKVLENNGFEALEQLVFDDLPQGLLVYSCFL